MSASFPRLIACVALLTTLAGAPVSSFAQIPVASSARTIPTEVEQSEGLITQIIARAEDHFRKGKLNLEDNKREQARDEFDKAVDSILESGLDVRASQRLQTFYLELVEKTWNAARTAGYPREWHRTCSTTAREPPLDRRSSGPRPCSACTANRTKSLEPARSTGRNRA